MRARQKNDASPGPSSRLSYEMHFAYVYVCLHSLQRCLLCQLLHDDDDVARLFDSTRLVLTKDASGLTPARDEVDVHGDRSEPRGRDPMRAVQQARTRTQHTTHDTQAHDREGTWVAIADIRTRSECARDASRGRTQAGTVAG